jgi:hypothetical protein
MHHFDLAHEEDEERAASRQRQRPQRPPSTVPGFPQALNRGILDRFADMGLQSEEPFFIFGMPRSGTTLLEQIVSRHSAVGAGGELFFWRDNSRRVYDLRRGAMNPDQLRNLGSKYLELIRSKAPGKAHVTDKFPGNYLYLGLLHVIFPKSVFLHARRHPIDTCLSIYMRPFGTNQGLGRTRREIVDTYRGYRESIARWKQVLGAERMLDVQYEQVVQDTVTTTRSVIKFCGLEWEDACLKPHEGDRRVITFSKWQVRQPVYKSSLERWRNYEPWLGIFRELLDEEHA